MSIGGLFSSLLFCEELLSDELSINVGLVEFSSDESGSEDDGIFADCKFSVTTGAISDATSLGLLVKSSASACSLIIKSGSSGDKLNSGVIIFNHSTTVLKLFNDLSSLVMKSSWFLIYSIKMTGMSETL